MTDQAMIIMGLRRRGFSPLEIAAQLDIPVSRIEETLRSAGNRLCEQTGKRCYSSKRRARKASATASNKIRVYLCEHGHHWHVTSDGAREHQPIDRRRWKAWD